MQKAEIRRARFWNGQSSSRSGLSDYIYVALPKSTESQILGKQVLRSGTSVGAQCREGHRSRSKAEFISKMNGALMELEETSYWLELLTDTKIMSAARLTDLRVEAGELTAIIVTIIKNTKRKAEDRK